MGLKKGTTNNPKGRPKGTKNSITTDIREVFSSLLEANIKQIQKDVKELSPKERINVILKVSEFVLPKLRSVEVDSKFTDENYQDYLRLKADRDRLENMTREELDVSIMKFSKIYNEEDWDTSKDGLPSVIMENK